MFKNVGVTLRAKFGSIGKRKKQDSNKKPKANSGALGIARKRKKRTPPITAASALIDSVVVPRGPFLEERTLCARWAVEGPKGCRPPAETLSIQAIRAGLRNA